MQINKDIFIQNGFFFMKKNTEILDSYIQGYLMSFKQMFLKSMNKYFLIHNISDFLFSFLVRSEEG